jgi:hypothetical protein
MRWRSLTRGLRSIISRWSWRKARAVAREIVGGRGVMLVNVERLDMVGDDGMLAGGEAVSDSGEVSVGRRRFEWGKLLALLCSFLLSQL